MAAGSGTSLLASGTTLGAPASIPTAGAVVRVDVDVSVAVIAAPADVPSTTTAQAPAPTSSPKRQRWYACRDSLARRLRIGKPGSRRRRRWDNNHFTEHPIVASHKHDPDFLHPNDMAPGYISHPSTFTQISTSTLRSVMINASTDQLHHIRVLQCDYSRKEGNIEVAPGEGNLTKGDRRLRQQIRRSGCTRDVVRRFEMGVVQGILSGDGELEWDEEYGWVRVETADEKETNDMVKPLCLEIHDRFLRLIVHAMCRYYLLASYSEDKVDGKRITYIHPGTCAKGDKAVPGRSFFDYLFT